MAERKRIGNDEPRKAILWRTAWRHYHQAHNSVDNDQFSPIDCRSCRFFRACAPELICQEIDPPDRL